jgi:hypothetical protein
MGGPSSSTLAAISMAWLVATGCHGQILLPNACAMHGCDPTAKRHVLDNPPGGPYGVPRRDGWFYRTSDESAQPGKVRSAPNALKVAWSIVNPFNSTREPCNRFECQLSSLGGGPLVCGGRRSMVSNAESQQCHLFKLSPVDGTTLQIATVPAGSPSPMIPTSGELAGAWNGTDVTTLYVSGTPIWDRGMQPPAPLNSVLWAPGVVESKYLVFGQGGIAAKDASNQLFVYAASGVPVTELCLSSTLGVGDALIATPPASCPLESSCAQRFFMNVLGSSCPGQQGAPCLVVTAFDISPHMDNLLSVAWTTELMLQSAFPDIGQPVVLDPLVMGGDALLIASAVTDASTLSLWGFNASSAPSTIPLLWGQQIPLHGDSFSGVWSAADQDQEGGWSVWSAVNGSLELLVTASDSYFGASIVTKRALFNASDLVRCSGLYSSQWQVTTPSVIRSDNVSSSIVVTLGPVGSANRTTTSFVLPPPSELMGPSDLVLQLEWCATSSVEFADVQPLLVPSVPPLIVTSGLSGTKAFYR